MYYDERGNHFDYINNELEIENEIKNDINNEYNFDITNININNNRIKNTPKVVNLFEGFNRGNMFENLYEPYKGHRYMVEVKGERDNQLLKIQMLMFALTDLNLYLDLNPHNKKLIELFNNYNTELEKLKKDYQSKFGPLTVTGVKYNNDFEWIKSPWPWDKGGNK